MQGMKKENEDLFSEIIASLPEGIPRQIVIGLHWTAVAMEIGGQVRCGLASTLTSEHHHGVPDVPRAGYLETQTSLRLANQIYSDQPTMVSVGMATINALLPQYPDTWVDLNAEEVIARRGVDKSVVLIGHFPFIERLRTQVGRLTVLELDPKPGDLPIAAAENVIPDAQVVAITGMTLLNRTFEGLLRLCAPDAFIILLGPSVPLSPVLFDLGVEILCGSVVTSTENVLASVRQGGNFRQVHKAGVQLVTITNSS